MFKLAENAITVCCPLNQSLMLKNRELKYFHFTGWNVVKNTSAYKILNIGSHQLVHVSSIIKVVESVVRGHILIKKKYVCLNSVLMYYDFQLWFRFLSKQAMRLNIKYCDYNTCNTKTSL